MKNLVISVSLLLTMILSDSSAFGQNRETRNVKDFTRVNFGVAGNLFIKIGPQFSLVIEGDDKIIDDIETEVSGGRLVIRKENHRMSFNDEKVTVNLTMPELEGLGVSGSGKAQILDPVESDDLDLSVSGSGKLMTSDLNVDRLDCGISGSGNIILGSKGNIDNGDISISGSGNFSGENIEIDHLEISVSGSGNCVCRAGDTLKASVSGSGNISYLGNPKVDARVSGSGHVRSK
jgi:hypothetical protein